MAAARAAGLIAEPTPPTHAPVRSWRALEPSGFAPGDDGRQRHAIGGAVSTLPRFFRALAHAAANEAAFMLNIVVMAGMQVEHVWVEDLDLSTMPHTGLIACTPTSDTLVHGQCIGFTPDQISDWMYLKDGYLEGGYTIKAWRAGLTRAERRAYDHQAAFRFRD